MRSLEESLFWEIFYRYQAVRSELARALDMSAATISRSAGVLLSKRLIVETGATISTRGRRPVLLQVNPKLAYVAGIELDRDRITAAITDLAGNLLGRGAVASSVCDPVQRTLKACHRAMHIALADASLAASGIARIGVGHTGMLDIENGICLNWQGVPHWRRVSLRNALRKMFEIEVTLDDRARAVALAQHLLWPENRRHRSAIYVQIGTGIGSGIFLNGRLLRGATLNGGEIGHIVIDRNGPVCACGDRGCVEAFASAGATLARVRRSLESGEASLLWNRATPNRELTVEDVVSAARQGDRLAQAALSDASDALGVGIANAVQLLNPSLVVLTGKFANTAGTYLLEPVTKAIREHCFETISRGLEVRLMPVRKDIGPVGCALLAAVDVAAAKIQDTLFEATS